jgi:hypothetical protein
VGTDVIEDVIVDDIVGCRWLCCTATRPNDRTSSDVVSVVTPRLHLAV